MELVPSERNGWGGTYGYFIHALQEVGLQELKSNPIERTNHFSREETSSSRPTSAQIKPQAMPGHSATLNVVFFSDGLSEIKTWSRQISANFLSPH